MLCERLPTIRTVAGPDANIFSVCFLLRNLFGAGVSLPMQSLCLLVSCRRTPTFSSYTEEQQRHILEDRIFKEPLLTEEDK
jgi:hypothetical protein